MSKTGQRLGALAMCAGALFAACSASPPTPDPGTPAPSAATPANETPSGVVRASEAPTGASTNIKGTKIQKIAIAYDQGGRGGGGFNDLAYDGAKKAADGLGVELKEITASPSDTDTDREERLKLLADAGYNPIIGVGFTYAGPLAKVAPMYPGTWFGIVDDGTVNAPNVVGILFTEEQGSFLVGVAAALKSTTGNIGFVGAVPIP